MSINTEFILSDRNCGLGKNSEKFNLYDSSIYRFILFEDFQQIIIFADKVNQHCILDFPKTALKMKTIALFILLLSIISCSNPQEKATEMEIEDEFVAPKNPFSKNSIDSLDADTSGRAQKAQKPGMKAPKLELVKKEISLDSMPAGKSITKEISFINSGEMPLEIVKVSSSRKADMQWSKLLIAASEQSAIIYKLKVPDKKGSFVDTVYILSNAVDEKLIMKGTVK
jgi:hypothetical protein